MCEILSNLAQDQIKSEVLGHVEVAKSKLPKERKYDKGYRMLDEAIVEILRVIQGDE